MFNEIYNNPDYWLIAFCITPWHLSGVKAFAQNHVDKTPELKYKKCAVVIIPHPRTGFCIRKEDVYKLNIPTLETVILNNEDLNRLDVSIIKSARKIFSYRTCITNNLYVLSTFEPYCFCEIRNFNGIIRRELVLYDEGVSSYLSQIGYVKHSYIESGSLSYATRLFLRLIVISLYCFLFNMKISRWMLFDKNKQYSVNTDVSNYYLSQFTSNNIIEDFGSDYILYLSQPPSSDKERQAIHEMLYSFANICKRHNLKLIIKCHPRDNQHEIKNINNVFILDKKGSIESLYTQLQRKPIFVMGFRSTALLTLKAFYNVKCISLLSFINKSYELKLNSDDKFFIKTFKNHFVFVKSIGEINELITSNYE